MELGRLRNAAIAALEQLAARHEYEFDLHEAAEIEWMVSRINAMREAELERVMTVPVQRAA